MLKIGCVIKAAGQGTRFGRNKLLEPLAGKAILAYVLDALPRDRLDRLIAVTSCPQVAALCSAHGIPPLLHNSGPVSQTIRLGIGAMEGMDGCLFVMGDQPLCTKTSMERMLVAFQQEPDCIIRLAYDGSPGSPVLFPSRLFPQLAMLTGEHGGMTVTKGEAVAIRLVQAERAEELRDVDTAQALAELAHDL